MTFQDYLDLFMDFLPDAVQFMGDIAGPVVIVIALVIVFRFVARLVIGSIRF